MILKSMIRDSKLISAFIVILAIICYLPFMYVCRYVHPVNDDYFYAIQHIDMGGLGALWYSYTNWSGRYLATVLSELNPLVVCNADDSYLHYYKVYSFLSIIIFVTLVCIAFFCALRKYLKTVHILGLSSLFLVLYICQIPRVSELFYWFSASTAYTLPSVLALLFFGIIRFNNKIAFICQCILALIIPGGNEVTAVLFVSTLLFIAYTYRMKHLYILAILSVIGIAFVILSPGNGIRMEGQLSAHPYLWTIIVSSVQTFSWLFLWLPVLIVATPVYMMIAGKHLMKSSLFDISLTKYIIFVLLSVFLAHVPSTLGLSSVVTARTANALYLFYILYYFFGIQIILNKNRENVENILSLLSQRGKISLACFAIFSFTFISPLSLEGTVAAAYIDIVSGKAADYDAVLTGRYNLMKKAKESDSDKEILFEPLGLTSRTLYTKDLESEEDGMFCWAYSTFYGLKCKVRVEKDDIRFMNNFDTIFSIGKKNR